VAMAASETDCPTLSAAEDGFTDTAATGITVTVIADVAVFPSDVPDIVADPAVTAVTFPLPSTVATDGALVAQVTTRPVSALPFASYATATSVTLPPITSVADDGNTATDDTGTGDTVTTTCAD